ncbi:MAG: hypothetical protein ACTSR8_20410 [Promethearchaeota archaeon]
MKCYNSKSVKSTKKIWFIFIILISSVLLLFRFIFGLNLLYGDCVCIDEDEGVLVIDGSNSSSYDWQWE